MRTWERLGACGAITVTFLLFPGVASSGGWWSHIDLDEELVFAGREVTATAEFLFSSIEEAEHARVSGKFFAYLIAGFDFATVDAAMGRPEPRGWWTLGGARAIRVGTVRLTGWDGNLAQARARFVIPDLEPGAYAVMFCDEACEQPLGDVVPTEVSVVADPLTARLARRVERLEARVVRAERATRRAQQDAVSEVMAMSRDLDALEQRVVGITAGLAGEEESPGLPWLAFAGWFVAGAAFSLALITRVRRRTETRPPDTGAGTPYPRREPDPVLEATGDLVLSGGSGPRPPAPREPGS